jgi:prepilin-type N-terminal cleavage/methylation domain-containing protein
MIKNSQNTSRRLGFTLIELLVVISIILIASSIIFIGGGGGDGAKLSSAQRIISGIAQGARGQAILKNSTTRLIIYSDASGNKDDEKKLRYFGIVYEEAEDSDQWIAATQGTYLPEGIYFNKDLSKDWPQSSIMNLNYPRITAQSGTSGEEYYYYEFNSNGTMANDFDNAWMALQSGVLRPPEGGSGSDLTVVFPSDAQDEGWNLKSALIFRRSGTTTAVNDPIDIVSN